MEWPCWAENQQRARGVGESNEMECEGTQLQQTKFFCKETDQHSRNANANIPNAYGLPLKEEWRVYASSELKDSKGDASTSNTTVEHADSLDGQTKLIVVENLESEGCESSAGKHACIDETKEVIQKPGKCCQKLGRVDSDPGQEVEPVDVPNKSDTLVTLSIKLESMGSSGIPCMYLGGTHWQTDDANSPGV